MPIDKESLATLHRDFPGVFPDTPPKPVPRPRGWFGSKFTWDSNDAPAFSDIPAIVGFLPFLEPASANPSLAKHPTYKAIVLQSFEQTIKDAGFIYPLRLNDDSMERMGCLDWVVTAAPNDLRRLMCEIVLQTNACGIEENLTNGIIPAILKRFRDKPRTPVEELSLLILSFDPMHIDYGYEDEYESEARTILEKLPLCNSEGDAQAMICEVFQNWFHDDGPKAFYASLSLEIWSWFQCFQIMQGKTEKGIFAMKSSHTIHERNLAFGLIATPKSGATLPKRDMLTPQQADELNQLFGLNTEQPETPEINVVLERKNNEQPE